MIREVSISSRTGYAYSSKRERIREACAILTAMSCVGLMVYTLGSFGRSISENSFSSAKPAPAEARITQLSARSR